jgi:1-acyl-sn-glycerol-3-phosphate acyltransferase
MVYVFLRAFIGACLDLFYRRSSLGGAIPAEGPIVLVGNHPNGLVDPMLVARISPRPVRFLGKAPLFKMPVVGALMRAVGALPVYRQQDSPGEQSKNEETFEACHTALVERSAICIFPEGVSHSVPHLQRMKTGAARIAIGAELGHGFTLGVRVVPVGLTYRNKHRFRGQVATEVGEPISVSDLKEQAVKDPRAAAELLTLRIGEAISRLTVNVEKWEDLPVLEAAAMIYAREKGLSLKESEHGPRLRRFADGLKVMRERDPARVDALRDRIASFSERLAALGANPADLDARYTPLTMLVFFVRNLLAVVLGLPLATLGVLFFYVPYQVPRAVITIRDPPLDIVATLKIATALVVFPAWYFVSVGAGLLFGGASWGAMLALLMPTSGWYAIRFLERREEALEDVALFLRLGLRDARKQRLLSRRGALAREIEALAAELEHIRAEQAEAPHGGAAQATGGAGARR